MTPMKRYGVVGVTETLFLEEMHPDTIAGRII